MQEKERTFFPMRESVRVAGRILLSFFFYCHVLKKDLILLFYACSTSLQINGKVVWPHLYSFLFLQISPVHVHDKVILFQLWIRLAKMNFFGDNFNLSKYLLIINTKFCRWNQKQPRKDSVYLNWWIKLVALT